jgi:uncharacterized damage-inducible protein DinB
VRALVRDFYGHQAWADSELWRAVRGHAGAFDDAALRERLHHIHQVQRAFLAMVGGRVREPEYWRRPAADFTTGAALQEWARDYHADAAVALEALDDDALGAPASIPWFQDPPVSITVGQALLQAAMHSHYHRGQNATRLRELGGEPPLTDLIVWYWKGRPAPAWS